MKKFYGKKFVATALAAIIAVSSISATVFADFPYEADELFMSEEHTGWGLCPNHGWR